MECSGIDRRGNTLNMWQCGKACDRQIARTPLNVVALLSGQCRSSLSDLTSFVS